MAYPMVLTLKDVKAMSVEELNLPNMEPVEIRLSFYYNAPICLLELHFISEGIHQVIVGMLAIDEVQRGIWAFSHRVSRRKDGEWQRKFLMHDVAHLVRASDVLGDYVRSHERMESAHVLIEIDDQEARFTFAAMLRIAKQELLKF